MAEQKDINIDTGKKQVKEHQQGSNQTIILIN